MAFSRDVNLNQAARQRVIDAFVRFDRPLILGAISIEIGHNIQRTEALIQELVVEGVVRPLTDAEKVSKQFDVRCEVYVRV